MSNTQASAAHPASPAAAASSAPKHHQHHRLQQLQQHVCASQVSHGAVHNDTISHTTLHCSSCCCCCHSAALQQSHPCFIKIKSRSSIFPCMSPTTYTPRLNPPPHTQVAVRSNSKPSGQLEKCPSCVQMTMKITEMTFRITHDGHLFPIDHLVSCLSEYILGISHTPSQGSRQTVQEALLQTSQLSARL